MFILFFCPGTFFNEIIFVFGLVGFMKFVLILLNELLGFENLSRILEVSPSVHSNGISCGPRIEFHPVEIEGTTRERSFMGRLNQPEGTTLKKVTFNKILFSFYLFYFISLFLHNFDWMMISVVEVCPTCKTVGRIKIHFNVNTVHKCPYGGDDKGMKFYFFFSNFCICVWDCVEVFVNDEEEEKRVKCLKSKKKWGVILSNIFSP